MVWVDDKSGKILAGLRDSETGLHLIDSAKEIHHRTSPVAKHLESTVITVLATNASLNRSEAYHVARMIAGTLGRTISPVHTQLDGDLVFVLSLGEVRTDSNRVGIIGAEVVAEAIKRAVKEADGFGIIPAWKDAVS